MALICLAAGVVITTLLSSPAPVSAQSVYTKVTASLDQIQTAHVTGEYFGGPAQRYEYWYDRDLGVCRHLYYDDQTRVMTDDGEHLWRYWTSTPQTVGQRPSVGMDVHIERVFDLDRIKDSIKRWPEADATVDGYACHAYLKTDRSHRGVYWIDNHNLIRKMESSTQRTSGEWKIARRWTATYNTQIPREQFRNPEPDASIIDLDAVQDRLSDSDSAMIHRLGLHRFVVHEIHQVQAGIYLMRCSLTYEPKPEQFEVFGMQDVHRNKHTLSPLAYAWLDGTMMQWYLVAPKRSPGGHAPEEISVSVNSKAFAQAYSEGTLEPWQEILIPTPAQPQPLAQIADHFYQQIRVSDLVGTTDQDTMIWYHNTEDTARGFTGSRNSHLITQRQFIQSIRYLIERD